MHFFCFVLLKSLRAGLHWWGRRIRHERIAGIKGIPHSVKKPSQGEIIGIFQAKAVGALHLCIGSVLYQGGDLRRGQRIIVVPQIGNVAGKSAVGRNIHVAVVLLGDSMQMMAFYNGSVDINVEGIVLTPNDDIHPFVQGNVRDENLFIDDVEGVHHDDQIVRVGRNINPRGIIGEVQPLRCGGAGIFGVIISLVKDASVLRRIVRQIVDENPGGPGELNAVHGIHGTLNGDRAGGGGFLRDDNQLFGVDHSIY